MSSIAALIKKNVTVSPQQPVGDVVQALRKAGQNFAVVLDDDKRVAGYFTYGMLLEETLPVSLNMGIGDDMTSITLPGAPGLVRRLQRNLTAPVSAMMRKPENTVDAESSLDDAARAVRAAGGTVIVLDRATGNLAGLITEESLLSALQNTKEAP